MTKNNELRLGNFVKNSEGKVCTVSQLFVDPSKEDEQVSISCNPSEKGSESISFIPLNPELLIAIGFKKKEIGKKSIYSNGSINLTTEFRLCSTYDLAIASIGEPIQHLHRLQNLHFDLYGTEMSIMKEDVVKGIKKIIFHTNLYSIMSFGFTPSSAPTPHYKRMMAFVDGENLVFNYQASLAKLGTVKKSDITIVKDTFVWHPATIKATLHEIIRATYYTSAVGDDKKIGEITSQIKSLNFNKDFRSALPNFLHPKVFKKEKQSKRTKGVDIQMTVDILTHVFNDNIDTVFLVTGDGDFLPIINEVIRHGKQVYLAAFKNGLNDLLLNSVDLFIDLDYIYFEQNGAHNLPGG